MKRILLIVSIFCLAAFSAGAQEKKFEIKTSKVSASGIADGKITISITETKAYYIYGLWDKAPWNEGTELSNSGQVQDTSYSFSDLKAGEYVVFIQFGDDSGNYETVKVE